MTEGQFLWRGSRTFLGILFDDLDCGGRMVTRIYNGGDGQAHFEDLNVPAGETETISLTPGANMTFRNSPDGSFSD